MSVSAVVIVLTTVICVSLLLVVQRKITKRYWFIFPDNLYVQFSLLETSNCKYV